MKFTKFAFWNLFQDQIEAEPEDRSIIHHAEVPFILIGNTEDVSTRQGRSRQKAKKFAGRVDALRSMVIELQSLLDAPWCDKTVGDCQIEIALDSVMSDTALIVICDESGPMCAKFETRPRKAGVNFE